MFALKALYQAYNLAGLQENTLTHRHSHQSSTKQPILTSSSANQPKINIS